MCVNFVVGFVPSAQLTFLGKEGKFVIIFSTKSIELTLNVALSKTENHVYSQKLLVHKVRLPESPGNISRSIPPPYFSGSNGLLHFIFQLKKGRCED